LRNIIAAAALNENGGVIAIDSLPQHMRDTILRSRDEQARGSRPGKLVEIEREHVARMLAYFHNDADQAAQALRMSVERMRSILAGDPPPPAG
jgi:transcriptional regulator with PAS, ATPase and Fis domain